MRADTSIANGGAKLVQRAEQTRPVGVMPYEVLRVVPVVHRRDPRALRSATTRLTQQRT